MPRHAAPPPPGWRATWQDARTYLKASPPEPARWWRWNLLAVTIGGAGLILAFPGSYLGTGIALAAAAALLGEVFR